MFDDLQEDRLVVQEISSDSCSTRDFLIFQMLSRFISVEIPVIKGNIIEDTVQRPMSYADVTIVNGRTTAMKEGQSSSLMVGGKNE